MQVHLTNETEKFCIIGDPVRHSKSPILHNAMFGALSEDKIYLCQPVKEGETAQWVAAAKLLGYGGFNATMPHKAALVTLMDELDEDAKLYESVNTVCIRNGKLYGFNTDAAGFFADLQLAGLWKPGCRVVVLGAGGAARSVALKLVQQGATVTVANRSVEKAEALCQLNPESMTAIPMEDNALKTALSTADLLVNATSLGMAGTGGQFASFDFLDALPQAAGVYDLIYHPLETQLLKESASRGHQTRNGLGMLVHQGILAMGHFLNRELDAEALVPVVEKAIQVKSEE